MNKSLIQVRAKSLAVKMETQTDPFKFFDPDTRKSAASDWQLAFNAIPVVQESPIFVYEWIDDGFRIFGYGCDEHGVTKLIKLNIKPGVFCVSGNLEVAYIMSQLWRVGFKMYDKKYVANNFAPLEVLVDPSLAEDATLCKFETDSIYDRTKIYNAIKYNGEMHQVALIPNYYSTTIQIIFERIHLTKCNSGLPKYVQGWFDCNLKHYDAMPNPPLPPIITFDIETVSSDNHRVPDGTHIDDVLYSVSVHDISESKLYTLIYLPLPDKPEITANKIIDDNYDVVPKGQKCGDNVNNVLEVFINELALLKRTMQLVHKPQLHILIGYNSINYDLKYLMNRCCFYQIHMNEFFLRNSIVFGVHQIHLDLFRIVKMRYKLQNYRLNTLCQQILGEGKVGVSAVNLRHSFRHMYETGQYLTTKMSSDFLPSIPDTLHYNNIDTLLVSKMVQRTAAVEFALSRSEAIGTGLCHLMSVQHKMHYMVNHESFMVGLSKNCFLGQYQPNAVKVHGQVCEGKTMTLTCHVSNRLMNARDETTQKKSFPGGANYCHGEYNLSKVNMYDYVVAYPKLIECANLSYETATIAPASFLLSIYDKIKGIDKWIVYDYMTHKGETKSETIILFYQYIYENMYVGDKFEFTREELHMRGNTLVILIWNGRPGTLSTIVRQFNANRVDAKNRARMLGSLVESLHQMRVEYDNMRMDMQMEEAASTSGTNYGDGGGGSDSDDDEDDDDFGFDIGFESTNNIVESVPDNIPATMGDTIQFSFTGDYIEAFQNLTTYIDKSKLFAVPDPVAKIEELIELVRSEYETYQNNYLMLKRSISSIYGCLHPTIGALVTSLIRIHLLQTASWLVSLGHRVHYLDTDSIMIVKGDGSNSGEGLPNLSSEMNRKWPWTEMELKVAEKCIFIRKKTYYKEENGEIMYGQNVNGPPVWNQCIKYFYEQNTIRHNDDILECFENFFRKCYNDIMTQPNLMVSAVSQEIRIKSDYRTLTPSAKFVEYIRHNYPSIADAYSHQIYYHIGSSLLTPTLRPICELETFDSLRNVNLFKYYQNMYATIFNIVKCHIRNNNQPFNLTLSNTSILIMMLNAFITVYREFFPEVESVFQDDGDDDEIIELAEVIDDANVYEYNDIF